MPVEFPRGSVTLDFAKSAAAATESFERYYVADLAGAWTAYTPGDEGMFSTVLESSDLYPALQDGGANWRGITADAILFGHVALIGDGGNLQWSNGNAAARNIVVMRHHLSTATYEYYHSADIAAGVSYVPADEGFFSHAYEQPRNYCEYKYNAAWWYWGCYSNAVNPKGTYLAIGDGTNIRFRNTDGGNARWVVIMRAIMVT